MSCTTIPDSTEKGEMRAIKPIVKQSEPEDLGLEETLPADVCWYDGHAYEIGGIRCQNSLSVTFENNVDEPYICKIQEMRIKWVPLDSYRCEK